MPRNPSRRLDLHLRVCRASRPTVEITRSGATFRAIRHRPSVPSESSAGRGADCYRYPEYGEGPLSGTGGGPVLVGGSFH